MKALPCGCRKCGCLCADHSPSRQPMACAGCQASALGRWLLADSGALVALGLLLANIAIWAALAG